MVPKNLSLRLRIRYTHSQDTMLRNQKYGKLSSPSRMHVQSIDGSSVYLSSSPLIDFPFNMRSMDGRFEPKNTIYLSYTHLNALKQTLRSMRRGFVMHDLFYLTNGSLQINEEIAEKEKQLVPIKGLLIGMQYCIIREMTGNNEYSSYEGIRIINPTSQTIGELTVDELDAFIDILDSMKIGVLSIVATQLGLELIKTPNDVLRALNIPREQIVSS